MGRVLAGATVVACVLAVGCTKSSPSAPSAPPAAPPAGTAAMVSLTPNSWEFPAGGGQLDIVIATAANQAGNVVAPNVPVTLRASSGTLSEEAPRTDSTGHARVTWRGASSATITARAGDVEGTANIRIAASPNPIPPTPNPGPTPPGPNPGPGDPPRLPDPGDPAPGPARDLVATITMNPGTAEVGVAITYSVSLTSSTNAAVPAIKTYVWDLNGDLLPERFDAAPTFTYTTPGSIVVESEVRTTDNRAVHAKLPVTIAPAPGLAATLSATPENATLNQPVTLTATATSAGNVGTLNYAWDFDANGTVDQQSASNSITTSFDTIGKKLPRVTVTGSRGGSATAAATVDVTGPALSISDLNATGATTVGSTLTMKATVAVAAPGTVPSSMAFTWDYGNGSEVVTSPNPSTVTHTYNTAGTYTVKVTATAPDGRSATAQITVVIS